jgi:GT2 family glycosyltransferase
VFDPIFRKAGDDVDICWRLQDGEFKIGFSPAGFVWHYRRATVKAYLKQQSGYGEAEALLIGKHPEHYNAFGGGIWRGRIYASSFSGLLLLRR